MHASEKPSRPPEHLGWPIVVKPCSEGSSIGVSIVKSLLWVETGTGQGLPVWATGGD